MDAHRKQVKAHASARDAYWKQVADSVADDVALITDSPRPTGGEWTKIKKYHRCSLPAASKAATEKDWNAGLVWQCPTCGSQYDLAEVAGVHGVYRWEIISRLVGGIRIEATEP